MTRMMKLFMLACIALCLASVPARADDMVVKLSRGVTNIVTSPLEYLVQYGVLEEEHDPMTSFLGAVIYGTGYTLARIVAGVYEVVSFPVPFPKGYASVMNPGTALDSFLDMQGREE